jgi:hypothetical protein
MMFTRIDIYKSLEQKDSVHPRFCSNPNTLEKNTLVSTK